MVLFLCFSGLLIASPQVKKQMNPLLQKEIRWLINGTAEKPVLPSTRSAAKGQFGEKEAGDAWTELQYHKHSAPAGGPLTPEQRLEAHAEIKLMEEATPLKGRSVLSPPSRWTSRGPTGLQHRCFARVFSGRASCIAYQPAEGLYVGAASGGLWQPGPFSFIPVTDTLPTLSSGAVAVHPVYPNVIFYGTGEYSTRSDGNGTGVYRSLDHGRSWSPMGLMVPTPTLVSRILIPPWSDSLVLVAGNTGIFRSTDLGGSWARVCWWDASDIAASTDGSVMYAGRQGEGAYRSLDQGSTWQVIGSLHLPSPLTVDWVSVAIAPSNPDRAYVQVTDRDTRVAQAILITDGARMGTPMWTNMMPVPDTQKVYMWGQGWYNVAMAVHPTDPNMVFVAGGAMLRSTNGGASWTQLDNLPHCDVHALLFRPGDHALYAGTDGGVFLSTDNGDTWNCALNFLLPITQFYNIDVCRSNEDVVFGATQDNATEGTYPGNRASWRMSNESDGWDVKVDWSNPSVVYTTTVYGYLYRSPTGGSECPRWPIINGRLARNWSVYSVQDPANASLIYVNGGSWVYFSTNQGTDWKRVDSVHYFNNAVRIENNSDGSFIYAIRWSLNPRVVGFQKNPGPVYTYVSCSDSLPSADPENIVASPSDPNRAYVLYNQAGAQRVFRTTNRGATWRDITGDFHYNVAVHSLVESPHDPAILFLGTEMGAFKTVSGGIQWGWWNRGMPNAVSVSDMAYVNSGGGDYIVAGTFGRGTYERDVNAPFFRSGGLGITSTSIANMGCILFATSDSGRIGTSSNCGNDWTTIHLPTLSPMFRIHAFDSLRQVTVGGGGVILRTTDGGGKWFSGTAPSSSDLRGLAFISDSVGYAVGGGGAFLRTTDGGENWSEAVKPFTGTLFSVRFSDMMNGYACGADSSDAVPARVLMRTTDGGQSWSGAPGSLGSGILYDVFFVDSKHGYCAADDGGILKTTDGGSSWKEYPTGSTYPLYSGVFSDVNNGWVCGPNGTLLKTTDGGLDWIRQETETASDLFAMALVNDQLLVGSAGGVLSREIEQPARMMLDFTGGWNLVSVPSDVQDHTKSSLFPDAVSDAFAFRAGYVVDSALADGAGYWLKFPANDTVSVSGFIRHKTVIDVSEGWNLIGSVSASVPAEGVTSEPPDIIGSQLWAYQGGYVGAGTVFPGKAYWVKVKQDGKLILDARMMTAPDTSVYHRDTSGGAPRDIAGRLNTLTVTDRAGHRGRLFFSTIVEQREILGLYEMPPLPPAGAFDARFSTGRSLECPSAKGGKMLGVGISGAAYPLSVSWEIDPAGDSPELIVSGVSHALAGRGRLTVSDEKALIGLRLRKGVDPTLPKQFALLQNYPNPFNPSTALRYDLPVDSRVRLVVYNVLGQAVATLVDGFEAAGYKQTEWNAGSFASGIYFYRLEATGASEQGSTFRQVKKMLLLK